MQTVRFKSELERNITIKLGYANAKVFRCSDPECYRPTSFCTFGSDKPDDSPCEQPGCDGVLELLRHVSFVDCPGHDILMATMLNGAAVMDAALLLIGTKRCADARPRRPRWTACWRGRAARFARSHALGPCTARQVAAART